MASTSGSTKIDAVIDADEISGQIAIGENILQVGSNHGVIIYGSPEAPPEPEPRRRPVSLLPRRPQRFLDRTEEMERAEAALVARQALGFHAPPGTGKTTLLRQLAHSGPEGAPPDGVVYHRVGAMPLEDLLQTLFEDFHTTPGRYKASPAELRQGLREIQALVILDDVDLPRDDSGELLDHLPQSAVLLAGAEPQLTGLGETRALPGLPPDDAFALFEQALGRPLGEEARSTARAICRALDGHPLGILQAAARAREEGVPLDELAELLGAEATLASAQGTDEEDQKLLAALAAVGPAPLPLEHLKGITKLADADRRLERLAASGLVERAEEGYQLTGSLPADLGALWSESLDGWRLLTIEHIDSWSGRLSSAPDKVKDLAGPVRQLMAWALGDGNWEAALRLARAVEGPLALAGRWEDWRRVLEGALRASVELGDAASEGWALHQLGGRAFGLGDRSAAERMLSRAAELRGRAGDEAGRALSEHLLEAARGAPLPPLPAAAGGGVPWLPLLAGVAVLAGGIGAGAWWLWLRPPPPATPPPTEVAPPPTASDTPTPSPTPSPSPSPTPTITATPSPPDLTIGEFHVDPVPSFEASGRLLYPAAVEVVNVGDLPAGEFKLSAAYAGGVNNPERPFLLPFVVEGQENGFYPRTTSPLEGGRSITFEGNLSLDPSENDRTLTLQVTADSCAGEEFAPEDCRVVETDEDNNTASVRMRPLACFDFNGLQSSGTFEAGSPPLERAEATLSFASIPRPGDDVSLAGSGQILFGWSQRLLEIRDLLVRLQPDVELTGAAFAYRQGEGLPMLRINGERRDVKDLRELDRAQLGDTELQVLFSQEEGRGVVVLEGPVKELEIGSRGGGLQLDNLCWTEVQP